jgi:hypothetical protein
LKYFIQVLSSGDGVPSSVRAVEVRPRTTEKEKAPEVEKRKRLKVSKSLGVPSDNISVPLNSYISLKEKILFILIFRQKKYLSSALSSVELLY